MKTYTAKPAEVTRNWHLVDASELALGRLSTQIAMRLMGKHKPTYTANIDSGDFVVVINAAQLKITGNKLTGKVYYRHSGYPGGIKQATLAEQLKKDPTKIIYEAVRGMLPANKLRDDRLNRLKIYVGSEHEHAAQKPVKLELER